jgi:ATP-dependent 26S proteasome regulatory subunit
MPLAVCPGRKMIQAAKTEVPNVVYIDELSAVMTTCRRARRST